MTSLAFPKPAPRILARQEQRRVQQVRLRAMILGVRKRDGDHCRACGIDASKPLAFHWNDGVRREL